MMKLGLSMAGIVGLAVILTAPTSGTALASEATAFEIERAFALQPRPLPRETVDMTVGVLPEACKVAAGLDRGRDYPAVLVDLNERGTGKVGWQVKAYTSTSILAQRVIVCDESAPATARHDVTGSQIVWGPGLLTEGQKHIYVTVLNRQSGEPTWRASGLRGLQTKTNGEVPVMTATIASEDRLGDRGSGDPVNQDWSDFFVKLRWAPL